MQVKTKLLLPFVAARDEDKDMYAWCGREGMHA